MVLGVQQKVSGITGDECDGHGVTIAEASEVNV